MIYTISSKTCVINSQILVKKFAIFVRILEINSNILYPFFPYRMYPTMAPVTMISRRVVI